MKIDCIPKHITNIKYEEFENDFYYLTYPGIKNNLYGIDLFGNIISLVKNREKYRVFETDKFGYRSMKLISNDNKYVRVNIQRLVAWEFVGQPEDYKILEVNHANGIHEDNYYKNLEWVTSEENYMHKKIYKLAAQSENHGVSNHKEKVVRYIIKLINKDTPAPIIAKKVLKKYPNLYSSETKHDYDRIRSLVSKIRNRDSWYNIKDEIEGSTTIEHILYEKHIGKEVSRVGLHPVKVRKGEHPNFFGW